MISHRGVRLYSQSFGAGFPVIILHGLLGSSDNWQPVARKLAGHFQVHTLDLRNHGRSPHADEFNYDVMCGDLREFMQTHQLPRCHVVGHSMGGKIAMHFALNFPGHVAKLVIVDIAPRAYPPHHGQIFNALLSLDLNLFKTRDEISQALAASISDGALRQFLLKNVGRDDSAAFRWKMNLPAIHRNYSKLNEAVRTVSHFDGPTLFIRGSKSTYLTDSDCDDLKRPFPASRFATVQEAGHWVHSDAPATFLALLIDFLR